MLPELRAFADKLMWDVANVRFVATTLPRGGLDKRAVAGGWTVRQIIGHLAETQVGYAAALERLSRGEPFLPERFDGERVNRESAERVAKAKLPELLELLSAGRDRTIAALEPLTAADLARPVAGAVTLGEVLRRWRRHYEHHAMDFVDALPALRFEPMMLNWVLYADYGDDAELLERQRRLYAEVRERYEEEPEGDE